MVSRKRHFLKTITWRIIGTLDTMILSWIITAIGNLELIGGVELITKMVLYYFHERVISWYKFTKYGIDKTTSKKRVG